MGFWQQVLLILAFFALALFITQSLHKNYPLPLHSDAWDHAAIARQINDEKAIVDYDPYNKVIGSALGKADPQIAYHSLLSSFLLLTGLQPVQLSLIIPTIVSFLVSLFAYVLVYYLTKNKIAGLFSVLTVLSLRTTVTTLGFQFMVPLAFGIAFMLLIIFVFLRSLEEARYILLLALLFIAATLAYPVCTVILLPVFAIYMLLRPSLLKKNWKLIAIAIVCLPLLVLPFTYYVKADSLESVWQKAAARLIWPPLNEWKPLYYYPEFLGMTLFLIAFTGFFIIIAFELLNRFKKATSITAVYYQNKHLLILPVSIAVLLPFVLHHHYYFFTYMAPYLRMFMSLAAILLLLAGITIALLFKAIVNTSKRMTPKTALLLQAFTPGLIAVFLLYNITAIPFDATDKKDFYRNIEVKQLPAIEWLGQNSSKDAKILALPWEAKAIYVITGKQVIGTTPARLGYLEKARVRFFNSMYFFVVDCPEKRALAEQYSFEFVYGKTKLDCEFLDKIYSEEDTYVYKINFQ